MMLRLPAHVASVLRHMATLERLAPTTLAVALLRAGLDACHDESGRGAYPETVRGPVAIHDGDDEIATLVRDVRGAVRYEHTIWRPGKNAPSLIADYPDGSSPFRQSSLAEPTRIDIPRERAGRS